MTTTEPVGGASPVIGILVFVFLYAGRATTVAETPSVSADSAACSGSAIAAFPMDRKVRPQQEAILLVPSPVPLLLLSSTETLGRKETRSD